MGKKKTAGQSSGSESDSPVVPPVVTKQQQQPQQPAAAPSSSSAAAPKAVAAAPKTVVENSVEIKGTVIALAHAAVVFTAFFGALAIGWHLHYIKIVKNGSFGFPDEWFPSISSTIGDWYPERNFFQIVMAAAATPRFLLVGLTYVVLLNQSSLAGLVLVLGVVRTVLAGGWTFVTSSEDHDVHDVAMIGYLVITLLHYLTYSYALTSNPAYKNAVTAKLVFAGLFLLNLVPLVYFFLQHKVHVVAGAYSYYAYFEWLLVLIDVGFDTTSLLEFSKVSISVVNKSAKPATTAVAAATEDSLYSQSFLASIKDLFVDMYLSFITWTLITSLGTMIWYFPLFNMSMSGEEAMIFSTVSPVLLSIPGVLWLAQRTQGFVQLLSLVGILAYLVPSPSLRLVLGGVAAALNLVSVMSTWYQSPLRRDRAALALVLGILFSVIVRVYTVTVNPLWPILNETNGGLQVPGLAVAVVCILDLVFLRSSPPTYKPSDKAKKGSIVSATLAFGALLFATQLLASDTSTLSRWIWTGYPDHGPEPFPHGLAVIGAIILGLLLSSVQVLFTSTPVVIGWWLVGSAGSAALYFLEGWPAFIGGLALITYIISLWPFVISAATKHTPAVTLGLGAFVCILFYFSHAFVVAYAFIPYGEIFRERTEYILAAVQVFLLLGILFGEGKALFAEVENKKAAGYKKSHEHERVYVALFVLVALAAAAASTRVHPEINHPIRGAPTEKVVTGGIWAVHFGYDNEMWASNVRMANLIRDAELDFIGLLESDTMRMFIGNRDVPLQIAEELGWYLDYGPRARDHTWGCALLSKFPITKSKHYLMPSPEGELACAIHATLDVGGDALDVLVAHNGQEETPLDRELQTKLEGEILKNATNPIVFIGYVVTTPSMPNYNWLVSDGNAKDIDPTDYDRWCEYIVYRNLEKVGYARISHGGITDTEIQVGRFRMNTNTDNVKEVSKEEVPAHIRFPALFDGKGTRGHRYHVFDKPKYFGK